MQQSASAIHWWYGLQGQNKGETHKYYDIDRYDGNKFCLFHEAVTLASKKNLEWAQI